MNTRIALPLLAILASLMMPMICVAAQAKPEVIRAISLHYADAKEMASLLNKPYSDGGLLTFVPMDIMFVTPDANGQLLVKASNEQAIDQLEQLVRLLDVPVKTGTLTVKLVRVSTEDLVAALREEWVSGGDPNIWLITDGLDTLVAQGSAVVVANPSSQVKNNTPISLQFEAGMKTPYAEDITITPIINADNNVTLHATARVSVGSDESIPTNKVTYTSNASVLLKSGAWALLNTTTCQEANISNIVQPSQYLLFANFTVDGLPAKPSTANSDK